jgi:hypothetical protein
MSTESEFDKEFEITSQEAWMLYGVQNIEDWDTID